LRKKIADERLLDLIHKFLKAGYMENWHWHQTWSGAPQGGVLSPLLSNVMLHAFDSYMEETWKANRPAERGHAAKNPAYNRVNLKVNRLSHRIAKETDAATRAMMLERLHTLQEERKRTPSMKPAKRLTFPRYADDWVILLYGYSKDEATAIKAEIAQWLKDTLKLTLNSEKTLITHWTDRVTFLGFELRGIKSRDNGARRAPRLIIPHETEERVKHTVAKLTRQSFIDPGDMIDSVNLVLKGWMNYSASVGRSPWQRKEVQTLQQGKCAQCGAPITEVRHRSALRKKVNASQSGYATTKVGLCHTCHVARTRQQRQRKDQQGKLSTPKGVRSV